MTFLKKIFSPFFFAISFLLLIYIIYKSEIQRDDITRSYYIPYYLLSLILIFFSIVTFFINQKLKEYFIISSISLVVALYMFESYLILSSKNSKEQLLKQQLYESKTGNKWDKRNKYQIYQDLKKINHEIAVPVFPVSYIYKNVLIFPLSGISNSETIFCNENGYPFIFQSDRYGFNNPDTEWNKKEIQYLLVGDSFTHGACVNRPDDIGSVLRTLSGKSVLNLGQGGNGPLIEYATLREYLNLNTKKVLWIYFNNDLRDLAGEIKNNILMKYLNDLSFSQNLKLRQNEIDELAIKYMNRKMEGEYIKLIKFIKIYNTRKLIFPTPVDKPVSTSTSIPQLELKRILQLVKKLVNENNSKLYFVYLPEYSHFKKNYDDTKYNLVKNIINELGIPFIDMYEEVFKKEENPLKLFPFELNGHYNIEGYNKVAKKIYQLTKN